MLKYTIGFIKRGDEILLLNREKASWMGCWNGVGGKLEEKESPLQCILREAYEETGIELSNMEYKGTVTWIVNGKDAGGMYVFLAEVPETFEFFTPIKTAEGILDWKKLEWILHPKNDGIANLHYFLPTMLRDQATYNHCFVYQNKAVVDFYSKQEDLTTMR
ncbi:8-oxo-dGTP diphosphatase [Caldibacillus lycopersici]|uniref:8-oxo-dGTP diphosphatase n=1 Tax=Perspicuibacillus lycopersici TaxID=1325689 RepID=A0AAE3LP61_9BACI|nr:8-oxo-dGTP diphosphatase [Perspicuibacillus lycopersici]MCU9614666.1 8-oxo-dGTP diphosphatase [Perspicuibacillus lycopersici]